MSLKNTSPNPAPPACSATVSPGGDSVPLLAANKIRCERDDRLLFENLSFQLNAGEIMQIEGPNGSGKTTLIRILCGLSTDYEGQFNWRGKKLRPSDPLFCRQHLYFGHATGVKTALTPEENLRWMAQAQGLREHQQVKGQESLTQIIQHALHKVGLRGYEDVPVHSLSAGQKRRVALARLFIEWIPLWVLDEPFTAIDRNGVNELEALLVEHASSGGAVILTTHHELAIAPERLRKLTLGSKSGVTA